MRLLAAVFALAAGVSAVVIAVVLVRTALADADPASDVLLASSAFYPYSPAVSADLQATLNAELVSARKARFPIKVALIAAPTDLGALPQLYGKPRRYAAFLDQEISFAGKVPLLVVMPDGYGGAGLGSAAEAVLASLPDPAPRTANGLAQGAIAAVRKLADAVGHPLGRVSATTSTSGGGPGIVVPLAVLFAVCAALAAAILALRRRRPRATPPRRR